MNKEVVKKILDSAEAEERDLTKEEVSQILEYRNAVNLLKELRSEDKPENEEPKEDESEDNVEPSGETEDNKTDEKPEERDCNEETNDEESEDKESGATESNEDEKQDDAEHEMRSVKTKKENNIKFNTIKTMTEKRFSIVRAIRSIANNQPLNEVDAQIIKNGAEEMRNAGISAQGQIQLPNVENRAAITVATEGEDIVATDVFDLLTPLRAKNVLVNAGARFYGGLQGNIQVPIMSKSNVNWASETATATDGAGTFNSVTLSPKRLTAYIDVSKQLLVQDSIDVENAIRMDLVNAINSKLEETILGAGTGNAYTPAGIFNSVSATPISSFTEVVNEEAKVEDANVLGECVYVMSNKAKAGFRTMSKGKANGDGLVFADGAVDGTKTFTTSHVDGKRFVYGDFSNLAIASWGNVDLVVDPYTKAADGQIRIVVNAFVDAAVLRKEAFAGGELM